MDLIPIVLCAGFGTRLRPLSQYVPKTVVPVAGWPVAYHSIRALLQRGARVVHCNTHFLAPIVEDELRAALRRDGYADDRIRFWHEEEILETGGGIARIVQALHAENPSQVINRGVLIIAGDVYAEAPIDLMIRRWRERPADAPVLLTTRTLPAPRPDVTWVDRQRNEVVGFGKDIASPGPHHEGRVFTTHQIIHADVILDAQVSKESSRDLFFRASLRKGLRILNVDYPEESPWHDIGDYSALSECIRQRRLGAISLPKQCLIMISEGDIAQNIAGRNDPAGVKSSGDFFRGFSNPSRPLQENLPCAGAETGSRTNPSLSSSSSGFSLMGFSLDRYQGFVSPLASSPVLPGGVSFGESARRLQSHCAFAPQPELDQPVLPDPGNPVLFFSLAGVGLPGPHPLLLPLELLERPLPFESREPLLPLYLASRTFFLFL